MNTLLPYCYYFCDCYFLYNYVFCDNNYPILVCLIYTRCTQGDAFHLMTSQSTRKGGYAFGQRQPPLYVAIQKILDKHPDGQIFKVKLNITFVHHAQKSSHFKIVLVQCVFTLPTAKYKPQDQCLQVSPTYKCPTNPL